MRYRRNEHRLKLICILYMKYGFALGLIDLPCPAYCNEILFLKSFYLSYYCLNCSSKVFLKTISSWTTKNMKKTVINSFSLGFHW